MPLINWNSGLTSNCYKLLQFLWQWILFLHMYTKFPITYSLVSWQCEKEKVQFEDQMRKHSSQDMQASQKCNPLWAEYIFLNDEGSIILSQGMVGY